MKKPSLRDRFRYAFDNMMAKGTSAQVVALATFTVVSVAFFSVIVWFAHIAPEQNFGEQFWSYLSITLQTDPLTGEPWLLRLSTLVVTLVAIFITSVLIGLLATGIEEKIEDLRKGRSLVIETGHTIVLGWTPAVFPIISELVIANQNQFRSVIVIMGEKDKIKMEEEIKKHVGDTGRTRVVCRTGNPMNMADLEIVSLNTARSILILGSNQEDPDISVIQTLLAITNHPHRREEPYHIVAEIHNRQNFEAARLAGGDEAELLLLSEIIARITAQTSRQAGLSVAYVELLDFEGDEIYYKDEPSLVGLTFGESLMAYEDSAVIGLLPKDGRPKLNPLMDTLIAPQDQIIAISEDDDTLILSGRKELGIDLDVIRTPQKSRPKTEDILLLGWNWRATTIINELDQYVAKRSKVTVLTHYPGAERQIKKECIDLKNLKVKFIAGSSTDRAILDQLPLGTYCNIILLSSAGILDPQRSDARTLITLLHLRDIKEKMGYDFSIVSEVLDIRNQSLVEVARADDFVISDRLISLMMTQISENKHLAPLFADILDADGSEIYIKPVTDYVQPGAAVNFYTVVEAARRQDQVAIGYRQAEFARDSEKAFGIVLNPTKSGTVTFAPEDKILVIALE